MDIHEKPQYGLKIRENGKLIKEEDLFDPLANITIKFKKGFKNAWKVLWKGLEYNINIDGTQEACSVIFKGDYARFKETSKPEVKMVLLSDEHESSN